MKDNLIIYKKSEKIRISNKIFETLQGFEGNEEVLYIKFKNKKGLSELNFDENEIIFDEEL